MLRQTSTQIPAGTLTRRRLEIRISASRRPKMSEKTIPIAAISRLIEEALEQELEVVPGDHPFPVVGVEEVVHAQFLIA